QKENYFFSSRRRHTRFSRDWSSDVCSSDLAGALSALMSTASGALLAVATLLANDVYRRFVAPGLGDGAFLRATRVIATTAGVLKIGRASCRERVKDTVAGG